jgi:surface polysaccharide O-acyltransferase-like enzyme
MLYLTQADIMNSSIVGRKGGILLSQAKRYIPEINLIRAIAILAVVMIHSTSYALVQLSVTSSYYRLYVFLHEFSSFAVPLFIFISGFVLCYTYLDKPVTASTVLTFYKKRMWNIAIPYTIFTVLYFILNYKENTVYNTVVKLSLQFLQGQAHGHLYFMFVIIQFIILFPLFLYAMKWKRVRNHIWWIGFLLQWFYYYLNRIYIVHLDGVPGIFHKTGSLFISYIAYFTFGIYLAVHFTKIMDWFARRAAMKHILRSLSNVLWLLSGAYYVYLRYEGLVNKQWADGQLFAYVWFVFNLLSVIAIFQLAIVIYYKFPALLGKIGGSIGVCSFGIYFLHPAILYYYRKIPVNGNSLMFHLYYFGEYLSALLIAWAITWVILRNFTWSWLLFGSTSKQNANKSVSASG